MPEPHVRKFTCSGCGKDLKVTEISILGPGLMAWCKNCRDAQRFMSIVMQRETMKIFNSPDYTDEVKMRLLELWELMFC